MTDEAEVVSEADDAHRPDTDAEPKPQTDDMPASGAEAVFALLAPLIPFSILVFVLTYECHTVLHFPIWRGIMFGILLATVLLVVICIGENGGSMGGGISCMNACVTYTIVAVVALILIPTFVHARAHADLI